MNTSLATRQFVRQVYGHFIGKGYYDSDEKFLKEAEKHGISRRTPSNIAKNMQFGDRVVFLRYGGRQSKTVEAFAEMTIDNLVLEHSIAKEVIGRLPLENLKSYLDVSGGGSIERGCGSFTVCGTYFVTAPISTIMEIAMKIAEDRNEKLFVMVGGHLSKVYPAPVILNPAPNFTRTFVRLADEVFAFEEENTDTSIIAIRDYKKKQGKRK